MKTSNIFLYDEKIEINNNIIFREKLNSCILEKKVNIIILNEELYIKTININNKFNICSFIKKSFGNNKDFLFNYFTLKNNKVVVYAIKGGEILESLCLKTIFIKVIPIQIYVLNFLKRKLKKETINFIFKFKNMYYYVSYYNGFINKNMINKNINEILLYVNEDNVYIDSKLSEKKELENKFNKIDMGEILNEKSLFKEKFFK